MCVDARPGFDGHHQRKFQARVLGGPLIIVGHGILELALVILWLLGLGPYLSKDIVFGIVGLCGALILIWRSSACFALFPL